ncbi:MAG TPA: deoxyribodipyrimidine photo-lyase [Chthoniobacterales bacterium]
MKRVIHWFRRDLRVSDNTALYHACNDAEEVIPVYIVSTWKKTHPWTGPSRQEFLCGCLEALARNLAALGGRLVIRFGEPESELNRLVNESGAQAIYTNRGIDPYDVELEKRLIQDAKAWGVEFRSFQDVTIHAPDAVLTQSGQPFRVFTPYARAWRELPRPPVLPKVSRLTTPPLIRSEDVPTLAHWQLSPEAKIIEPGERAARTRLKRLFSGPVFEYAERRNLPGDPVNSRLSQDLRWGTLSPRQVFAAADEAARVANGTERRSVETFMNEIVWREFYMQILWHHPEVLHRNFSDQFEHLRWDQNEGFFRRWCEGTTGFPLVDAGMRELQATGFMHNRLRMITAMFLTKDLHLHWRQGEKFFSQKLIDGDIASNNGGWQWSAGTGADASPYFRIQNPWNQTKTYDPEGLYIKQWVPELRDVRPADLIKPSSTPLARNYPVPMVDHAREREETLERFNEAKRAAGEPLPAGTAGRLASK